ncbi:hypothetical protein V495_00653 [Pseudogymnoascus sp. VKM F-4514 (FW-929)]|nr:hypothetical protein V495_00653 [Pseudogymnoascus sp. VKM F-4514 (FW-929)]
MIHNWLGYSPETSQVSISVKGRTAMHFVLWRSSHDRIPLIASPFVSTDAHNYEFRHYSDNTNVELLFDLFFVANLSTFNHVHQINNAQTLTSYICFFAVVWWTWLQVAFFDTRFAVDSIMERVCKVIQLSILIGFASVGSHFLPHLTDVRTFRTIQTLDILLMASRTLLAIQYAVIAIFAAKKNKNAVLPLMLVVLTFVIASAVYLGNETYLVWYAVMALEALVVIGVAINWPLVGFRYTHLIKRVGTLTLIILGEGASSVTQTVNEIVGQSGWNRDDFGQTITVIIIIYLLWQFYVSCFIDSQQGSVRQQVSALLHFPFHVGLVLLVEGAGKFILLHHVFAQLTAFWDSIALAQMEHLDGQLLADILNITITSFNLGDSGVGSVSILPGITKDLLEITKNNISLMIGDEYTGTILDLNNRVQIALYSRLGVTSVGVGNSSDQDIDNISSFFEVVYIYFFVSAGSVILFLALFKWLGHNGLTNQLVYLSIMTRTLVGAALISLTATLANGDLQSNYTSSSMILPTILLALTFGTSVHFLFSPALTSLAKGPEKYLLM